MSEIVIGWPRWRSLIIALGPWCVALGIVGVLALSGAIPVLIAAAWGALITFAAWPPAFLAAALFDARRAPSDNT